MAPQRLPPLGRECHLRGTGGEDRLARRVAEQNRLEIEGHVRERRIVGNDEGGETGGGLRDGAVERDQQRAAGRSQESEIEREREAAEGGLRIAPAHDRAGGRGVTDPTGHRLAEARDSTHHESWESGGASARAPEVEDREVVIDGVARRRDVPGEVADLRADGPRPRGGAAAEGG